MNNEDIPIVIAAMLLIAAAALTYAWVNIAWQNDCEQLGQTRSGGKVYECKLKEVRK